MLNASNFKVANEDVPTKTTLRSFTQNAIIPINPVENGVINLVLCTYANFEKIILFPYSEIMIGNEYGHLPKLYLKDVNYIGIVKWGDLLCLSFLDAQKKLVD